MFKNYLIIAFRNFWRKKVFSIINIAGLAIGMSAALVIYLIVLQLSKLAVSCSFL